jgi:hypothetical protein
MTVEEREERLYEKFWDKYKPENITPCPFCGRSDIQIGKGSGKRGKFYYMYCESCFAKSGTSMRTESALMNWQVRVEV